MRSFRLSGMSWTVILCVIATLCLVMSTLGGCEGGGKVDPLALQHLNTQVQAGVEKANIEAERARDAATLARDDAQKALDEIGTKLKAKLAAIDAATTQEEKAKASEALTAAQALQTATQQRLNDLTERLAKAEQAAATMARIKEQSGEVNKKVASVLNPDGSVSPEGVASVVAPLLPPPWNVIAAGGLTLLGLGVGEMRRRQALTALQSVVDGLEKAKNTSAVLKTGLKDSAPILLSSYTPLAKEVVRKAAA